MKIIIKESNKEKIDSALNEVQGKARTRKVSFYDIERYATCKMNCIIEHYGISKKAIKGLRIRYMPDADNFSQAYKYRPEATYFIIEYGNNGIAYLVGCGRDCADRRNDYRKVVTIPNEMRNAIIESYEKGKAFLF